MEAASAATSLDQLSVDTIRTLSIDGIQKANNGHPGNDWTFVGNAGSYSVERLRVLVHSR